MRPPAGRPLAVIDGGGGGIERRVPAPEGLRFCEGVVALHMYHVRTGVTSSGPTPVRHPKRHPPRTAHTTPENRRRKHTACHPGSFGGCQSAPEASG